MIKTTTWTESWHTFKTRGMTMEIHGNRTYASISFEFDNHRDRPRHRDPETGQLDSKKPAECRSHLEPHELEELGRLYLDLANRMRRCARCHKPAPGKDDPEFVNDDWRDLVDGDEKPTGEVVCVGYITSLERSVEETRRLPGNEKLSWTQALQLVAEPRQAAS